jgi:hypothetical protein
MSDSEKQNVRFCFYIENQSTNVGKSIACSGDENVEINVWSYEDG